MQNLFEPLKHFRHAIGILAQESNGGKVILFSEGNNHWRYIRPVVDFFLSSPTLDKYRFLYITQARDDCGIEHIGGRAKTYVVGKNNIRDYVLNNLSCDLLLTSTPDIGQFDVKRSPNVKHYAYIQHSLNSLHMAYRENAFREFDTVFCSTLYHEREVAALCDYYGLPVKNIACMRYEPIFELKEYAAAQAQEKSTTPVILIAPTWGEYSLIESGVVHALIDILLAEGAKVVIRPHPETVKRRDDLCKSLSERAKNTSKIEIDLAVESFHWLVKADILVTDCSGISFDFGIGLEKPVIFFDVKPKINNQNYTLISSFVAEIDLRGEIGLIVSDLKELRQGIQRLLSEGLQRTATIEDIHSETADKAISSLLKKLELL